jgi:hypothetical protein
MNPSRYGEIHTKIYHSELDSEKRSTESLPLQEKNHNNNQAMNSTIYKSLAKKYQQTKKINLRLMKLKQGSVIVQTLPQLHKKIAVTWAIRKTGNKRPAKNST